MQHRPHEATEAQALAVGVCLLQYRGDDQFVFPTSTQGLVSYDTRAQHDTTHAAAPSHYHGVTYIVQRIEGGAKT